LACPSDLHYYLHEIAAMFVLRLSVCPVVICGDCFWRLVMVTALRFKFSVLKSVLAFAMGLAFVLPVTAGAETLTKYVVRDKAGKTLGLMECSHVEREEGIFASSAFYKGAKAVESKKGMKPLVRSYGELASDATMNKYKRWKEVGSNTHNWVIFKFGKDFKKRFAVGESNAKLVVLGKQKPVYVIERDQPYLAALLLKKDQPERTVSCVGAEMDKIGEASVKLVGTEKVVLPKPVAAKPVVEGAEGAVEEAAAAEQPVEMHHWKVGGSCGDFDIWQTAAGKAVKIETADTVYELVR
jgi:hypothetical protein